MNCVECGKESTYWLCSNACALAYAKKRGTRECAICSYDAKSGRVGRHDTIKICAECRRHSENADWRSNRKERPDAEVERRNNACRRLRDEQDRALPEVTETTARIAKLIVEGARADVGRRDRQGRRRGKQERWRALSIREIAARAQCPRSEVERFIRHVERGMSWLVNGARCTDEACQTIQTDGIDRDSGGQRSDLPVSRNRANR
jgi:hypothetical protein